MPTTRPPNPDTLQTVRVGRSRRFWVWRGITAVLIVLGTAIASYPFAAQWTTQQGQNAAAEKLSATLRHIEPAHLDDKLDRALEYNRLVARGLDVSEFNYHDAVAIPSGEPLARLSIPSINLNQTVRHTLDESVLSTGLGHMEGSSLPVGGESSNAVIGGHRGLATAVGFTNLNKVNFGDDVFLDVLGDTLTYRVVSYEVLSPGDADMQPVQGGRDLLTLVTCTPIGLNTDRIVVVTERVTPDSPDTYIPEPAQLGFPWWALGATIGAGAAGMYLWLPLRSPVREQEPLKDADQAF